MSEPQPMIMSAVSFIVPNYNHARLLPKRIEASLRKRCRILDLMLLDIARWTGAGQFCLDTRGIREGDSNSMTVGHE